MLVVSGEAKALMHWQIEVTAWGLYSFCWVFELLMAILPSVRLIIVKSNKNTVSQLPLQNLVLSRKFPVSGFRLQFPVSSFQSPVFSLQYQVLSFHSPFSSLQFPSLSFQS